MIVIETWSEPPGLDSIPSEPHLSASIVIDTNEDDRIFFVASEPPGLDSDDGVDAAWSKPPGLGLIPDESIVIETWSEPPGLSSIPSEPLLRSSIDDGVGTAPGEQHKKI